MLVSQLSGWPLAAQRGVLIPEALRQPDADESKPWGLRWEAAGEKPEPESGG